MGTSFLICKSIIFFKTSCFLLYIMFLGILFCLAHIVEPIIVTAICLGFFLTGVFFFIFRISFILGITIIYCKMIINFIKVVVFGFFYKYLITSWVIFLSHSCIASK